MSRDYRLNWRLKNDCQEDATALCPSACSASGGEVCGGKMLRCLMDNKDKLKTEACRQEVFYFIRMDVRSLALVCCGAIWSDLYHGTRNTNAILHH
jgi:hypothetical protein